jgi:hypothetical protein
VRGEDGRVVSKRFELAAVGEVGYLRSEAELRLKARRWLAETIVNEVLLIWISKDQSRLWAEVHRRGTPGEGGGGQASHEDACVQHEDFGECRAFGEKVLRISLASIFNGEENVPKKLRRAHPDGSMLLDLHEVRKKILMLW